MEIRKMAALPLVPSVLRSWRIHKPSYGIKVCTWARNPVRDYICPTDRCVSRIFYTVIRSFKDKETEQIYGQRRSKKIPPEIQMRALVKMMMIDSAETVSDLTAPPSNRREKLSGARSGEYCI